jgi:plasmid maintenance system antidote protein VapI
VDPKGTMEHTFGTTDILHKYNVCISTVVFSQYIITLLMVIKLSKTLDFDSEQMMNV